MRIILVIIFICFLQILYAGGNDYYSPYLFPSPDSIPSPPGQADPLTGPSSACIGDTSVYSVDVPVACNCQWAINDIIQPGTGSTLTITWTEEGLQVVSVVFVCAGEQTSDPDSISVTVYETPGQPGPISGDAFVCEYTYHTYSTVVGPYDSCEWTVNDVVQPGFSAEITYSFSGAGTYMFEVIAYNPCGTSIAQTLTVTAQGSAPSTPTPVQGPGESCSGETEIYTTTVGPGETCLWWIDGVLQSSTTTTLEVTWSEWGEHQIEVRAVSDCGTGNPTFKDVQVLYQPDVFLGNDTTILQGKILILDAGNLGSDYLWSTGETTQTLLVSVTGTYSVNVTNFCGTDSDTIEVSVYVGLAEDGNKDDCFRLISHNSNISFPDLNQDDIKIQIVDLSGKVHYKGVPVEIKLAQRGIYLIRFMTPKTICYKKIFIF